jgi:hypothetical protein
MRNRIIILIVSVALGCVAMAKEEPKDESKRESKEEASSAEKHEAFEKMKTLIGSWEGTAKEGKTENPTNARFQSIADGSVLAGWLEEGTPHEMVTMFHMDGDTLMATHYCAAHNQPRMVLVMDGEHNRLVFVFKDGTNIKPEVGHMHQVAFILDGPNHHIEEWTYLKGGKKETTRFDFKRKK